MSKLAVVQVGSVFVMPLDLNASMLSGLHVQDHLRALDKQATSWKVRESVEPLTHEDAQKLLNDKIPAKRILRNSSRACDRDMSRGIGPF